MLELFKKGLILLSSVVNQSINEVFCYSSCAAYTYIFVVINHMDTLSVNGNSHRQVRVPQNV